MLRRFINAIFSGASGFESYYQKVLLTSDLRIAPSASEALRDYHAYLRQQQASAGQGILF